MARRSSRDRNTIDHGLILYSLHRVARENKINILKIIRVVRHESFAFSKIWNIQERNEIPITLDKYQR
jgi:predicted amino acid-binding ACT domain protein